MADFIRLFIPTYFISFFIIAFLGISLKVSRRIGKNPSVFPKDDSAYAFIGKYFKLTLLALFGYTILIAWIPDQMQQIFIIYSHFKIYWNGLDVISTDLDSDGSVADERFLAYRN